MSDRSETFGQALALAVEQGLRHVYTCLPARVVKWDSSKGRADCQILVKDVTRDEEDKRQVNSWPVIPGCVVQFMGSGDYRLAIAIRAGSTDGTLGTLFFAHRSIDKWLTGTGSEVDPEDDHAFGLQDAIFVPGLRTFGGPWSDVPDTGMKLGKDGGLQATFTDDLITLAESSGNAQFVALAQKVADELDKIKTAHNTHVHVLTISAAAGAGGTGTAAAPAIQYTPASVAASKVKAE